MKTRIISGLIMVPIVVGIIYYGGWALLFACFLIGIIGVKEFFNGFHSVGIRPCYPIGFAAAVALYLIHILELPPEAMMLWVFGVVLCSLLYLFRIDERQLADGMATVTGIFYVIFFSYHLVLIDQADTQETLIWLVFLTAFGTDVMAYFAGVFLGKHKLCPKISPKKTIEGSVGGILGSVILCGIFGYFFTDGLIYHCLIIGALGGVVSQFGDLTASIFKRKMGIKDYGKLIPGHGGILDRFDSVLFTAPLVYYYMTLIILR